MQPQFYMYCFPWDLEDEGLEESIGRLAGEIGVDGINVAATTSEILHYRPRKPLEKRVFKTEAGAHFQPDKKFYSSCRIKPHPAAWMKSRNALERIVKVCEKEKLKVRASINCCVGRAMVERYPFAACVNAFGTSGETVLCPTHPEVREYLASLVEDLSSNYGLNTVELTDLRRESFFSDFGDCDVLRPAVTEAEEEILGWCFCSACRQNASSHGANTDMALQLARARLEQWLDDPADHPIDRQELIEKEPGLVEYQQSQLRGILDVFPQLKKQTHCDLTLQFEYGRPISLAAIVNGQLKDHLDRVNIYSFSLEERSSGNLLEGVSGIDPQRLEVIIYAGPSGTNAAATLVSATHRMVQHAYHAISFSNYGYATQSMLDAIRQAIRFARRETR